MLLLNNRNFNKNFILIQFKFNLEKNYLKLNEYYKKI